MADYIISQITLPNNDTYDLRAIAAKIPSTQYGVAYYSDTTGTFASTVAGEEGQIFIGHENNSNFAAPGWYNGLILTGNGTENSPFNAEFSNTVTIGGNTTIGNSEHASTLTVYGTTTLRSNANIIGNTIIGTDSTASTLEVYGTSTLTGRVGIGCAPDSATTGDQHILKIKGSTLITTTIGSNEFNCAHIDVTNSTRNNNNIYSVNFYPESNAYGDIGDTSHRWYAGYFSHLLNISDGTSSININTNDGTLSIGIITITASVPTIQLDTLSLNEETWTFTNTAGEFELTNSANNTVNILGTDNGWQLNGQIGINTAPESWPTQSSTDPHILVINGSTLIINGNENAAHLDLSTEIINSTNYSTINFYPQTNKTGQLGLSDHRWSKVYLGDAVTYGDEYTPIYWNNGVPVEVDVVKVYTFSFANGGTKVVITPKNINKAKSIVTEIVVDTGMSYLNGAINWEIPTSDTDKDKIVLTTTATSGVVSGYILVSIGT